MATLIFFLVSSENFLPLFCKPFLFGFLSPILARLIFFLDSLEKILPVPFGGICPPGLIFQPISQTGLNLNSKNLHKLIFSCSNKTTNSRLSYFLKAELTFDVFLATFQLCSLNLLSGFLFVIPIYPSVLAFV